MFRTIFNRSKGSATTTDRLKARERRSDITVAAMGIALGLGCAMFPWYVFLNQEQFGIKAMRFSGQGGGVPGSVRYQPELIARPIAAAEAPRLELDFLPTGTLPDEDDPSSETIPLEQQPFPGAVGEFQLVHVANGRAMIQDEDGLWLVKTGSVLPDASRVSAIEKRGEEWVLVTSGDRIIRVGQ